jgi:hypothetical protein
VDPDRLFVGLDGRNLSVAGRSWTVAVYGVCDQAGRRWVQLALDGASHYMLTLRLAPGDGVAQAVLALSGWLGNSSRSSAVQVMNVA